MCIDAIVILAKW